MIIGGQRGGGGIPLQPPISYLVMYKLFETRMYILCSPPQALKPVATYGNDDWQCSFLQYCFYLNLVKEPWIPPRRKFRVREHDG